MDYVMSLEFTEAPNFDQMKQMVTSNAVDADLNIFDNVFDWSILLTNRDSKDNPLAHMIPSKPWEFLLPKDA